MIESYLQSCKVNNAVNAWVVCKDLFHSGIVCNVDVVVRRSLSGDELNSVDDFFGRVVEVVDDYDFIACFEERDDCEGADVASTSVVNMLAFGR